MSNDENNMNESQIADLLQQVGARSAPPQSSRDEIKANVKSAWLEELQLRQKRSKQKRNLAISFALAASLVLAIGLNVEVNKPIQQFATITQTVNQIQYEDEQGLWHNVDDRNVYSSTKMRTLEGSYAAIELSNGLNMRLDSNTEITLIDLFEVKVASGSIYIDSDSDRDSDLSNNTIRVSTPFGNAQDIGTQFEVKVTPDRWRVQVRAGSVEMVDGNDQFLLAAGERIEINQDSTSTLNTVKKSTITSHDASWSWTQSISTPFELQGETLDHYLTWVSRETGDAIKYRSAETESAAKQTTLSGSLQDGAFKGLTAIESVPKVLQTTSFTATISTDGIIFVDKKSN
ncbi:MAG: ferric-dicitrate binding protein FerR (iron transport regulator) [Candidatus Azotimanducaceae bacterium]|jgi:ferric-dicitrate binding protein FerR (iron transport regulator)